MISREGNGISREVTVQHGREQERTGFHGKGPAFHGILWYITAFHGRERGFTGENGISRERTGFHGRELVFKGDHGILRENTGFKVDGGHPVCCALLVTDAVLLVEL